MLCNTLPTVPNGNATWGTFMKAFQNASHFCGHLLAFKRASPFKIFVPDSVETYGIGSQVRFKSQFRQPMTYAPKYGPDKNTSFLCE